VAVSTQHGAQPPEMGSQRHERGDGATRALQDVERHQGGLSRDSLDVAVVLYAPGAKATSGNQAQILSREDVYLSAVGKLGRGIRRKTVEISLVQFLSPSLSGVDFHASVWVGASGGSGPLSTPMGDPQAEGEAGAALATSSVVRYGSWCEERRLEGRRLVVPQWPGLLEGQWCGPAGEL